jgi:hypothetical protein
MNSFYEKSNYNENIQVGDLISLKDDNTVIRSYQNYNKRPDTRIIGVCVDVIDNQIEVQQEGIVTINIVGLSSIGSLVTASEIPGKARVLKYEQEQRMFNIRSIGKIINLYNDLSKVDILLDIE